MLLGPLFRHHERYTLKTLILAVIAVVATASHADPLADFKALVKQCSTAFENQPAAEVLFNEKIGKWVKRMNGRAQIAYDVKKTDSLVSPLTAYLTVTQIMTSKTAADETSANNLAPSFDDAGTIVQVKTLNFRLAESDGRWAFVDGSNTVDFKSKAGPTFDGRPTKVSLSKDGLKNDKGIMTDACLTLKALP